MALVAPIPHPGEEEREQEKVGLRAEVSPDPRRDRYIPQLAMEGWRLASCESGVGEVR